MMEDLYLQRKKSNKGCVRVIIILVIIIAGVFTWRSIATRRSETREDQAFEQVLQAEEDAVSSPEPTERKKTEPVQARRSAPKEQRKPEKPGRIINARELLADAELLYSTKDYASVQDICYDILDGSNDPKIRSRAEELLGTVHLEMVYSPYPMAAKKDYTIQRGDTLGKLAKKYDTTVELIRKGNNVKGSLIHVGDRYRILSGSFSIVVDKSDNDLVLNLNDRFFKRYRVGTGKFAKTPAGEFKITSREAQPTWWRPDGKRIPYGDPENLLGTHWMSINVRGYGIHGTWEPESIGKQSSAGCIRMLNDDIEELYTLVPIGTPVKIQE